MPVSGTRLFLCRPIVAMSLVVGVVLSGTASAQTSSTVGLWTVKPDIGEMGSQAGPAKVAQAPETPGSKKAPGTREWLLAPLPMINPTLENGLAMVGGMLYTIGSSQPSASLVAAFKTSNDSWMGSAIQTLHLGEDRYRILGGAAYFDVNYEFFGIGEDAGNQGVSIPINQSGTGGVAEMLVRTGGKWYVGGRYRITTTTIAGDFDHPTVPIPLPDVELRTAAFGPRLQRDTRDNQFYPRSGSLFDATAGFAGETIGGHRNYQQYLASFSSYTTVAPRQVLAAKINSCAMAGDAPFYDLCLLGQFQDLRGYPAGQYRDRGLLTAQAEYRVEVWKFIGAAFFGGTGAVAPSFKKLSVDALLPSGGAGLRFRLTKKTHVNLRVDYAWGKNSEALYISVAEAF